MKKILYGSMTGLALFLVAGCTSKTPTAVSSTNEQKETVISTTETSSSVQQEATTTSEDKCGSCLFRKSNDSI